MLDFAIFWEWLSFAARWLHVITGIAWIGSSFYFVALDLGLRQRPGLPSAAGWGMRTRSPLLRTTHRLPAWTGNWQARLR